MASHNRCAVTVGLAIWAFWSAAVTCALVIALIIVGLHSLGYRLLSVQSVSMQPTFSKGDAIVLSSHLPRHFQPGQIITYHRTANSKLLISHRIVSQRNDHLQTAGDATGNLDPTIAGSQVIGRVIAVAPDLGRTLDIFHHPLVLGVLFYLPLLGLLGIEIGYYRSRVASPRYTAWLVH